jgi:hypothetical protein
MTAAEEVKEKKQLDSVTDVVQEKELDASRAQEALSAMSASKQGSSAKKVSKIKVDKAHVDLLMNELEVTEEMAVQTLREVAESMEGDTSGKSLIVAALTKLVVS